MKKGVIVIMKVMFISKELNRISGSSVSAKMHRDCLIRIVGEENLFTIDLSSNSAHSRSQRYVKYGKYKSLIDRVVRHIQGYTYDLSKTIVQEICSIIADNNIQFVFIDDSVYGKLVKSIKLMKENITVVSFFHDVKANLYPIWMKREKIWLKTIDMRIGLINEKESVLNVDANIVLNSTEDELLFRAYGKHADYYFPVCVEKEYNKYVDSYVKNGKKHILFVGTSYYPNLHACLWFSKEVIPHIRKYFDFYIVGKGLECLKTSIDDPDVHIIGFVDNICQYYQHADCVVAPLTDGGGMKIKTAEAISYGKVFIGSEESLRGYYDILPQEIKERIVFCCNNVEEYREVFGLLRDQNINKCNDDLVDIYLSFFSTDAADKLMRAIMKDSMQSHLENNLTFH